MAAVTDICVPELGMTAEEVEIERWCVAIGDPVRRGEPVAELATDKATVELEAVDDGVLTEILAGPGETVRVGGVIGRIGPADGVVAEPQTPTAPTAAPPSKARATPVARRMAQGRGLDLAEVAGSGPGGRIRRADVEAALASAAPSVSADPAASGPVAAPGSPRRRGRRLELSPAQRRLAAHLVANAVPQFSVSREVDVTAALAVPRDAGRPSFADVLIKAVAATIGDHERLNATFADGELTVWERVDVGFAVAVGPDLFVPVVRDAGTLSLRELAARRGELTQRARDGALRPADTADATVVVSNMGALGVNEVEPVVTPPQVCLLGVGAPVERLLPMPGEGAARRRLLSLRATCDHRAVNGATAAAFLADLAQRLSNPFALGEV